MRNLLLLAGGLAIAGTAYAAPSASFKGRDLLPLTRVSLETARATALKARAGNVTDEELEKEKGGSGLRYSFDIASAGKAFEVGVDAKTGKVLENKAEGKNPD